MPNKPADCPACGAVGTLYDHPFDSAWRCAACGETVDKIDVDLPAFRGTLAGTAEADSDSLPTDPPERPAGYNRTNPEPGRVWSWVKVGRQAFVARPRKKPEADL